MEKLSSKHSANRKWRNMWVINILLLIFLNKQETFSLAFRKDKTIDKIGKET